ncbi:MAG: phosphoglucosamine mutase, partial [Desulfurobacteriaceae bacterium]
EASLELVIFNKYELPKASPENIGRVFSGENLVEMYEKFLESAGRYLAGLKIGIDCANGATFKIAPLIFKSLGAKVFVFNAEPDGKNINENCGATSPEFLASKVKDLNLDVGFAYDGDGDRCIAIDEKGRVVDGDEIMAILAAHYMEKNKTVVATVMSNIGLELFLKELGIELIRTNVGDRFVSEKMVETGTLVGGEQSGHIILRDFLETGDGLLTSIILASIVKSTRRPLSELSSLMKKFPQKLKNIGVKEKKPIEKLPKLKKAIEEAEKKLSGKGRVLVRYSGTEPLLRIMVEAEDENLIDEVISLIEAAVKEEGIQE